MKTKDKTVSAAEFKVKCLWILDHLKPEGVVITKQGRAVARVIPMISETPKVRQVRGKDALKFRRQARANSSRPSGPVDNSKLIGALKDEVLVLGDIFSTGEKWDAES
jgi:antitoxin (DNA-binding transcriptional repressor) of toxin-antitoxin stability system